MGPQHLHFFHQLVKADPMRSVMKKWGNGAAVRIPAALLKAAHLHIDQPIDIRAESGRIIIASPCMERYDIDALVGGITNENRHNPIGTDPAIGEEVV